MGEPTKPRLGEIARKLRLARDMTLENLSGLTGLSKSTLSKVENEKTSLTYENIVKLAAGLGVSVGELFAEPTSSNMLFTARRTVGRKGEGKLIRTVNYGDCYLCADLLHKKMVPVITHITAKNLTQFGKFSAHPGEEFTCVMSGLVEFYCEAYDPVTLAEGDYVYFDASVPHAYLSLGEKDAIVLTVMSSPDPEHF